MPKLPAPDQRPKRTRYQVRHNQRGARIAALQARVAELEAQVGAQRALQATAPTERLNTLLAVSAALLVTHDNRSDYEPDRPAGGSAVPWRQRRAAISSRRGICRSEATCGQQRPARRTNSSAGAWPRWARLP